MRRRKTVHEDYEIVKENLKSVFSNLRKNGFISRMNFSCCSSCAAYELSHSDQCTIKGLKKILFYSRQEEEMFKMRGNVHLNYFSATNDDDNITKQIGLEIIETIKKYPEISFIWDQDPSKTIIVKRAIQDG